MKTFVYLLAAVALAMADDTAVAVEERLQNSNNHFSASMFSEVVKKNAGKSVVMSGYSAMSPLAQLSLASAGESQDEILKALNLPDVNATKEVFSYVNQRLRSVKGVELKIANSVFIPEGHELNEEFASVSRDVFNSDVQQLNFVQNEQAAKTINTWVEDHTNKRIKDLVDPSSLGAQTRAVLVNAIFFKGSWKEKFDKEATQERDFHVTKDKTVKVPMMFQNGNFKYGYSSELDAQLLELFYEGEEASFLIVLPNQIDGITSLEEKLKNPQALVEATSKMYSTEVDVHLPKFKIETTINLKEILENMGVNNLFNAAKARLENLLKSEKEGLFVSDAIQKAFIEVNEEGAEAAAASVYNIRHRSGRVRPRMRFDANKPFYFVLKHAKNEIFTGLYKA